MEDLKNTAMFIRNKNNHENITNSFSFSASSFQIVESLLNCKAPQTRDSHTKIKIKIEIEMYKNP